MGCAATDPSGRIPPPADRPGRNHILFVRHYIDLPLPLAEAEQVLLGDVRAWVPALAGEASEHGARLLAQVGLRRGSIKREVEIEFGPPARLNTSVLIPMTWRSARLEALFPVLEADLMLAAVGPRVTQLSLNGRYEPPLGAVGRALDRALLHRIAEATVRDFLERVAVRLFELAGGSGPPEPATSEGEPPAPRG